MSSSGTTIYIASNGHFPAVSRRFQLYVKFRYYNFYSQQRSLFSGKQGVPATCQVQVQLLIQPSNCQQERSYMSNSGIKFQSQQWISHSCQNDTPGTSSSYVLFVKFMQIIFHILFFLGHLLPLQNSMCTGSLGSQLFLCVRLSHSPGLKQPGSREINLILA